MKPNSIPYAGTKAQQSSDVEDNNVSPFFAKPHVGGSTGKLRPCDCKDSVDTSQLEEQGIGHNDESIMVCPNYVLLTMGHTTVKIGMARFKMFAEWYLGLQG